jgi:hypothetical protein
MLTPAELNTIRIATADAASIACDAYATNPTDATHDAANVAGDQRLAAHDAYTEAVLHKHLDELIAKEAGLDQVEFLDPDWAEYDAGRMHTDEEE